MQRSYQTYFLSSIIQ